MPRQPRYVKNKRVGSRGTIVRGDQIPVEFDGLVGGAAGQDIWESSVLQRYDVGARRLLPDGRVFRYAKATNTITDNKHGLKFWGQLADGIGYTAPLQVQVVGDRIVIVDGGKGAAGIAEDELRNGYLMLHTHGDSYQSFRRIIGNTVADSDGYVTITVDMPWNVAITTSHGVEVYLNPYVNVQLRNGSSGHAGDKYSSIAGFPFVVTAVANLYIWIQTWGPIWVNTHGNRLQAANIAQDERQLVFDFEGSVSFQEQCVGASADGEDYNQLAGFLIARGASGTAPTLIMLQISP